MKRFLLFRYDSYYPSGARGEAHGDYDTLDEAIDVALGRAPDGNGHTMTYDHFDVLDLDAREWVAP